jgi:hypothetical protein
LPRMHREFHPHLTVGQFETVSEAKAFLKTHARVHIDVEISCVSMLARDTMKHPFRTTICVHFAGGSRAVEVPASKPYSPYAPPLHACSTRARLEASGPSRDDGELVGMQSPLAFGDFPPASMHSKSAVGTYAAADNVSNVEAAWPNPSESIPVKPRRSCKGRA